VQTLEQRSTSLLSIFSPPRLVNGTLFFVANDGVHGQQLWKSDGTPNGTVLVRIVNPNGSAFTGASPPQLLNVDGTLFFGADDGVHGMELWRSDGTAEGTFLVKDINPGPGSSTPLTLTNVNGILYFRAFEPNTGFELWRSDGTEAGTFLVDDINPGPAGSGVVRPMANVDGTLLFAASEPLHGTELWMVPPDGSAAPGRSRHSPGSAFAVLSSLVREIPLAGALTTQPLEPTATPTVVLRPVDVALRRETDAVFAANRRTNPRTPWWQADEFEGLEAGLPLVALR
jgi:ELWxxDGT repeat protein